MKTITYEITRNMLYTIDYVKEVRAIDTFEDIKIARKYLAKLNKCSDTKGFHEIHKEFKYLGEIDFNGSDSFLGVVNSITKRTLIEKERILSGNK